jgi:ABC-type branched-subunit amino acid transport system substrate-binding protein
MKRLACAVAAVVLGAAVAACGSSGSSSSGSSGLTGPIKLGFLWEIKGESAYAIDDYQNGAAIALSEINAAGGIDGHKVETVRLPASPVDPQALSTNFLQMASDKPAVIIGIPGLDVESLTRDINNTGIPVLGMVQDNNISYGAADGSKWLFQAYTSQTNYASSAARYVVQGLGVKKIGLMYTDEQLGNGGAAIFNKLLPTLGATVVAQRSYDPAATDLTEQVLAMKGAGAVIDWGYPNPMAVQLKQFVQNGISIPTMQTQSAALNVADNVVSGAAIEHLYSTQFCNAANPNTAVGKAFAAAYQKKYHTVATANAVITYDMVKFAVAAIKQAGSADPDKVLAAINSIKFTNGACTADYHSDGSHVLMHQIQIVDFPGGKETTLKTYTFPDAAKANG